MMSRKSLQPAHRLALAIGDLAEDRHGDQRMKLSASMISPFSVTGFRSRRFLAHQDDLARRMLEQNIVALCRDRIIRSEKRPKPSRELII